MTDLYKCGDRVFTSREAAERTLVEEAAARSHYAPDGTWTGPASAEVEYWKRRALAAEKALADVR